MPGSARKAAAAAEGSNARPAGAIHVLLVEEDGPHARKLVEAIDAAGPSGVEVVHVHNLTEAVDLLAQQPYDAVMVDASLHERRLEPLHVLRRETPDMAVLVIIGHDDDELGLQSVQAGAQDYLVKSRFTGTELVRNIRMAIERQRVLNEARALSFLDTLTGLNNRRGFVALAEHHLRIASRSRRPMMLLFIDLDGLKSINDHLGHQHGDAAISEAAAVLRESFRETDLIARLGGDEFAVLALEAEGQTADILLGRLNKNIATHNSDAGRDYQLSMSVGVAHFNPEAPQSVDQLLGESDALMYQEKTRKHAQR